MLHIFQGFLAKMKASFQRIARATKHEMSLGDLHNDAWVIALEIGDRRGSPVDFSDPADQNLVMGALYSENVKRGDWEMRRAVRIDQDSNADEESIKWIDRLPAQASSDPLVALLQQESIAAKSKLLAASYSQAAAYIMVFIHFNNDRDQICSYLVISNDTLSHRVMVAADVVRAQPSLFDRIESIPANFMPLPGKKLKAKIEEVRSMDQSAWDFGGVSAHL